jgi:UDP-N-acetylmuramoyl-L-alanyl-D-glutamate--2,6-diaminopimelate ligase
MRLSEVLADVEIREARGPLEVEVTGLAYDSRRVRAGDVFFALAGLRSDGQAFVRQAVAGGAAAVVGRSFEALPGVVQVRVDDARLALAQAACRYHGYPSRTLEVVAVTGTNGKTTTTWLVAAALEAAGRRAGVIGTIGYRLGGEIQPAAFTTPESVELQGLLATLRERGARSVALEVSSHALHQRRSYGLECDVVAFTNLSHDHLDYHGTMEEYLDAKLRLFDGRNGGTGRKRTTALVNADDPRAGRVLEAARRGTQRQWTYGRAEGADLRLASVGAGRDGLEVELRHAGGRTRLRLPLLGEINAMNAAAAFGAALALGIPAEQAARGLERAPQVPGRLERVEAGQPFEVVVDYAHTPDALERVMLTLRAHVAPGGKLIVVFGCGGDRDRAKRPRMGELAARLADRAIVTSDNPRSEDPRAIIAEIVAGVPAGAAPLEVEPDRRAAIARALQGARPGDVVLIAGKGHEATQTIADQVLPFDDRAVARELLGGRAA